MVDQSSEYYQAGNLQIPKTIVYQGPDNHQGSHSHVKVFKMHIPGMLIIILKRSKKNIVIFIKKNLCIIFFLVLNFFLKELMFFLKPYF